MRPLIPLILLFLAPFAHAQSASFSWNRNGVTTNPGSNTTGYKLHIGTASGVYTQTVDAKTAITTVVPVTAGTQYYAVVKAYNAAGIEGAASLQVAFNLPKQNFNIGSVITATDQVNVRSTPAGALLGAQPKGMTGTVNAGPQVAIFNGINVTWWKITVVTGPNGWIGEDNLILATGTPGPTPNPPSLLLITP